MATANIIELKACMKDCLLYCEAHRGVDYIEYHYPRLRQADEKFHEAVAVSDRYYTAFAQASVEDKKAWKAVSTKIIALQQGLKCYEVSGYPKDAILYWDIPVFRAHVKEMLDWLAANKESYPDAKSDEAGLRRLCEVAEKAREARNDALEEYSRQAQFRSSALGALSIFLTEFRQTLHRKLGTSNSEYLAIRWPFSLAPDRPVLV